MSVIKVEPDLTLGGRYGVGHSSISRRHSGDGILSGSNGSGGRADIAVVFLAARRHAAAGRDSKPDATADQTSACQTQHRQSQPDCRAAGAQSERHGPARAEPAGPGARDRLWQSLAYTAGVASESRSNFGGYDIMYSRGFILDQYLDGMKLQGATGQSTPQPELYGLERVEVLRGPASMLFGQGSPGGLVNMISKRPSEIPFNEAIIQGGSYDRIQGGFDSTGKIDKDGQFLYRITGFAKDADNQVNYVKDQRYYIAPSLT
jgi:hypothetical protein